MKNIMMFIGLISCLSIASQLRADAEVGKPAPDFKLTDVAGNQHVLSQHKGKFVVLEWTNYDCPFTKKFYDSNEMQKMQKEYTGKGVIWLSICSSASGKQGNFTPDEILKRAKELDSGMTTYLIDDKGVVGKMYGAKTTPTVFVVNPQGTIVYGGAVDDIPSTNIADIPKAKNYLRAALDETMSGKPVTTRTTKSYGCSVKY